MDNVIEGFKHNNLLGSRRMKKKGKGIVEDIKNFAKKHKKKIAGVAGAVGALGTAALGAHLYQKYKKPTSFGSHRSRLLKENIPPLEDIPRNPEEHKRERRSSLIHTPAIDVGPPPILDFSKPYNGLGRKKKGKGIFDKAKEFVKKHKKKIAAVSGAVLGTAALGTAAALGHKAYKKHKRDQLINRYLDPNNLFPNLDHVEEQKGDLRTPSSLDIFRQEPQPGQLEFPDDEDVFRPRRPYSWVDWAANLDEEKRGLGLLDKLKEFTKKHKKKLVTAAALGTALGTTAVGAHILNDKYNQYRQRQLDEAQRRNVLHDQYVDLIANGLEERWARERIQEAIDRENAQGPENDRRGLGMKMLPNPMNPETGLWEGSEQPLCRCGNTHDVILEKLGGITHLVKLAKKHHYKKYMKGNGLVSDIHSGITKGFNLIGKFSMDALIEIAVAILGERFRKGLTRLIKKYGWKSLNFIKKYAHKGLTFIKKEVEKQLEPLGSGLCKSCPKHYEKIFKGGASANFTNWFVKGMHSLGDVLKTIVPGPIGAIASYIPSNVGKVAELINTNYKYKDPLAEEGSGMCGGNEQSKLEKFIDLIPFDILGSLVRDKISHSLGNPHTVFSMFEKRRGRGKKEDENKLSIGKQLMNLFPYEILKDILKEYINMPNYGIVPENKKWNWRQPAGRGGRGRGQPEISILPTKSDLFQKPVPTTKSDAFLEPEMRILPYFGGINKITVEDPYYKLQDPNYNTNIPLLVKNDNSDYKEFNAGMHNPLNETSTKHKVLGGKNKKKLSKKQIKKILKFKL